HTLAAFIDEESVAADSLVVDRGVAGQDFRIDITEDHLRRRPVVPRHHPGPELAFTLQQRAQMVGVEVPEIQYLRAKRLRRPRRFDWGVKAHEGACARLSLMYDDSESSVH